MIVYAYALFNEWNGVHVAQKIQTLFIDDIDGSEAEGTVRFALDGAEYEIDLNAKHAEALRKSLARYIDSARRSSGGSTAARRPARSGRRAPASGLNTTEVREWAKAQGIEVKDRGRVPAELVVKFKAATGQLDPGCPRPPPGTAGRAATPHRPPGRRSGCVNPSWRIARR